MPAIAASDDANYPNAADIRFIGAYKSIGATNILGGVGDNPGRSAHNDRTAVVIGLGARDNALG